MKCFPMCGITGFVGAGAFKKALEGLKTLEYRGYYSAGTAFLANGKMGIVKTVGDVASLLKKAEGADTSGSTTAIAHTRWATHGGVTDANAHPHADCTGKIAIIHNGIIENYSDLREELKREGHRFASQTDTEVISHQIEEEMKGGPFGKAALAAARKFRGSYAILAICSDAPGVMVAAKNESPLVIASGPGFAAAASDPVPLLPYAKKGVFLEDGDFAVAEKGKIEVYGIASGEKIGRGEIGFGSVEAVVDKKDFPHFMLKEIYESQSAMKMACAQDAAATGRAASEIRRRRTVFVACGTSRHAALVGRYLFNRVAGKICDVVVASEFPYIAQNLVGNDLFIIAVSQSGETADVLEGVKIAKAHGAKILSVTNAVGSSLDRIADYSLHLNCGPEVGVAATKTFMAQLSIMFALSSALSNGKAENEKEKIAAIARECQEYFPRWEEKARALSQRLKAEQAVYFIARGPSFPAALEGALKFKEITYIHAEGMAAGELKHGTLALVSSGTPIVAVCPDDYTRNATISNVMETKARGAFVIGVSDRNDPSFDEFIEVPRVGENHYPLAFAIPLQLLAYHTAVLKGNNPDRPRNLAKSVTVK